MMGMTDKKSIHTGRRLYECDNCGDTAPWGRGWLWFGSYKDVENGVGCVPIFCSRQCLQEFRSQQVARNEPVLPVFDGFID